MIKSMHQTHTTQKKKQGKNSSLTKRVRSTLPDNWETEMAEFYCKWLAHSGYTSLPSKISVQCFEVRLGQRYPAYEWRARATPPGKRPSYTRVSNTEKRRRVAQRPLKKKVERIGKNRRRILRGSKSKTSR